MKPMSDSEAMDYAHKKLSSDLDGIESHSIFDESNEPAMDPHDDGVKIEAHGVSLHLKPMNGQQDHTSDGKDLPAFKEEKEEEEGKFGL